MATIFVNDSPGTFVVDTGFSVNILPGCSYDALQQRPTIHDTATQVFTYRSKQAVPVLGFITTHIKIKKKCCRAKIFIVDDEDPLLGHELQNIFSAHSAEALGIITFNFAFHVTVPIPDEFPSLFDGKVGKISGSTINLHALHPTSDPTPPQNTLPRKEGCRGRVKTPQRNGCYRRRYWAHRLMIVPPPTHTQKLPLTWRKLTRLYKGLNILVWL